MAYPIDRHPLLISQGSGHPDDCLRPDPYAGVLALAGIGERGDVSGRRHRKQHHRLRGRAGREAAGGGIRDVRGLVRGGAPDKDTGCSSGSGRLL